MDSSARTWIFSPRGFFGILSHTTNMDARTNIEIKDSVMPVYFGVLKNLEICGSNVFTMIFKKGTISASGKKNDYGFSIGFTVFKTILRIENQNLDPF